MPKLTIVLPTYNRETFLPHALDNILAQSFTDFELICVNDASTDSTASILEDYAQRDNRIKIIHNAQNKTLPGALNTAFEIASGEYYTWTSDDNYYKADALLSMVNYLDTHLDTDLVTYDTDAVNEEHKLITVWGEEYKRKPAYLAAYNNVAGCYMYRKELAKKVGPYNVSMFGAEDHDYWCRCALMGTITYMHESAYIFVIHSGSISNTPISHRNGVRVQQLYNKKLLQKYPVTKSERAEIYMGIFKFNKRAIDYFLKAFLHCPVTSFSCLFRMLATKLDYWLSKNKN